MQKIVTVTINVEKLQEASKGAFTVTEVEEINALLEEGWGIEEWEFITGETEKEKAVLFVILNDEVGEPEFDDDIYNMERDSEDDETEYDEEQITNGMEDADNAEEGASNHLTK